MAKGARFGRWSGGFVGTLLAVWLALPGAPCAAGLSCTGLPAAGAVTSNPISCAVNCTAGGTVASAVALKPRTTNRLTITISGTCVASTDDVPGGITLQGASSSATLLAPKATTDPVLGISGTGVILSTLTISGGVNALRGRSGSAFTGTNLVIEGASNADVLLKHAVVTLNTSTIQNSAADGIDGDWGSGGVVQGNSGYGANFSRGASLDVFGGALLQKNGVAGAQAGDGATVFISGGTVKNNATASGGVSGLLTGHGGHLRLIGAAPAL